MQQAPEEAPEEAAPEGNGAAGAEEAAEGKVVL
jgi:hypothetical protein